MLVKHWMNQPAVAIASGRNLKSALALMKQHEIHMLSVVSDNRLIGMVFEDDFNFRFDNSSGSAPFHPKENNAPVDAVMRRDFPKVTTENTVEETAELMLAYKMCKVPVIDRDGYLVGTLSREDVLNVLINLTGARRQGILFIVRLKNRLKSIQDVTDLVRSYGGRMISFLAPSEDNRSKYRKAYIRMYGIDRFKLLSLNEKLADVAELIYVKDRPEVGRILE